MSTEASTLPFVPRLMPRDLAALYLSMGVSTFDREVKEGRIPAGFRTTEGLLRWDRRDLDAWIDAQKERQLSRPANEWDDA
ncbi:helix-turn-helix transcriptional regulator [Roseococcus sp. DSY-14]|uniref:helix-turn-helix transcriptional regulator n=1 Tax=Roseococcus sp. DSY-14 TaxID=3369650 RepID=UPI00387B6D8F